MKYTCMPIQPSGPFMHVLTKMWRYIQASFQSNMLPFDLYAVNVHKHGVIYLYDVIPVKASSAILWFPLEKLIIPMMVTKLSNVTEHESSLSYSPKSLQRSPHTRHFSGSISFLLPLLWSIKHPWNTLFHFSFLILGQSVGLPGRGDQSVARPLLAHRTTQTQNKRTQTSMPWVGLKPIIPAFERAKTVHALDARPLSSACLWGLLRV
jgi:hypothetical protein